MDVMISIRSDYVYRIMAGLKQIEIRTRRPRLDPGDVIWVYETLPAGVISLRARVDRVITMDREKAWRNHRDNMGVSRREFLAYTNTRRHISLIFLDESRPLHSPISLKALRNICDGFVPPQFMRKVREPALLEQLCAAS